MAAPNIIAANSITGRSVLYPVTATLAAVGVDNAAASNSLIRISTIIASNKSAGTVGITLTIRRGGTDRYIASTIPVPQNASIVLLSKVDGGGLNLEEGDSLFAQAGSASAIDLVVSYELIS